MTVYTVQQTAKILQVCDATVKTEIRRNRLKAIKVGTEWRIPEEDLIEYLEVVRNNYKTKREVELEKENKVLTEKLKVATKKLLIISSVFLNPNIQENDV